MLDRHVRPLIDPPLNRLGHRLAGLGIGANAVTALGLMLGLGAALAVASGSVAVALGLMLASRLADGLDGAVARATRPSDFGGVFDIAADFVFYAALPLAFVWVDPVRNGLAGASLIAAFYINAASFLGYAILAAKQGHTTQARGQKSWYHAGGLMEGTETIVFFAAFCLWPALFPALAWVFAALCLITATGRMIQMRQTFD
ncbi:MAG: CDP-alcohol phosphatidyltransferase family protein [Rhodobacter sp.]|nr:CDP-alcohol phosphatidyltransferase family protein [Paracoccaceae bacterium]MCC0079029.1 CDP-alcohol phosphatidyltransferase family protein [Rhodobacter sp.]